MLKITRELSNSTSDRTSVPLGSSNISTNGTFLRCSADQPSSSLAAPSVIWLKDGTQLSGDGVRVVITTNIYTIMGTNRTVSFVRIFNFSQSDAGVYQCVFYDTPSQGGEVITTKPYKVDTGMDSHFSCAGMNVFYLYLLGPVFITAASPLSVTLCPPEPMVLQMKAGGEYAGIQWSRTPIALNISSDELVDFQQTFVRTVTSEQDWGLYLAYVILPNNSSSNIAISISCNTTVPSKSIDKTE